MSPISVRFKERFCWALWENDRTNEPVFVEDVQRAWPHFPCVHMTQPWQTVAHRNTSENQPFFQVRDYIYSMHEDHCIDSLWLWFWDAGEAPKKGFWDIFCSKLSKETNLSEKNGAGIIGNSVVLHWEGKIEARNTSRMFKSDARIEGSVGWLLWGNCTLRNWSGGRIRARNWLRTIPRALCTSDEPFEVTLAASI